MEGVLCSDCGAEACDPIEQLTACGWDLDGEYGAKCPLCRSNAVPDPSPGLDGIVEVTGAIKRGDNEAL